MPPKFKFTKQQIIQAALDIVRAEGPEALTARALAKRLNSSPKPIFGLFSSMQELFGCVLQEATRLYGDYIKKAMSAGELPPYKASGMAYIRFAEDERQLFKLLFMRDRTKEKINEERESVLPLLKIISKNLNVDEDTAYLFHIEMWIYVHGFATMVATSYLKWDTDFINNALTDVYMGLCDRFAKEYANDGN